jgi:hypothetical protein
VRAPRDGGLHRGRQYCRIVDIREDIPPWKHRPRANQGPFAAVNCRRGIPGSRYAETLGFVGAMAGFASGVPARGQPRRFSPDLPSGPPGPPRPPVARIPAVFSSCSSAAGSELEPSGHISPEGFSLPGCVQRTCPLVVSPAILLPMLYAKPLALQTARPPPVPPGLPARGIPCGGRRDQAPGFGAPVPAPGDPGRCGGVDEAACGARKELRRAEPAASGRKVASI